MSHALREHAFGLMSGLCRSYDLPQDSLRLATHMLVNLGDDAGSRSLETVAAMLPWLAALLDTEQGVPARDIATNLEARGALSVLNSICVAEELEAGRALESTSDARRELERIAMLDRRLGELVELDPAQARTMIQGDSALITSVVRVLETSLTQPGGGESLTHALKNLCDVRIGGAHRRSESLAILRDLESSWNGGDRLKACALSERSRRFELSSADHLSEHGFLVAIRAALCFGQDGGTRPGDAIENDALDTVLSRWPALRDDPALRSLARALCGMRFACLAHVRGAIPLSALSPWVHFLRGACAEIAEARGVSLREATSFAHYSLHLMNFCDLVAYETNSVTERTRRNLMDLEDELKEFALVGQQQGLTDLQANLERYDSVRWKGAEEKVVLCERIARLRGAWRQGIKPAPLGAPPRVDMAEVDAVSRALDHLEREVGQVENLLGARLGRAYLVHQTLFEDLEIHASLRLLTLVAVAADGESSFTVDLRPLEAWIAQSEDHTRLVQIALHTLDLDAIVEDPSRLKCSQGIQITTDAESDMEVSFRLRPETRAVFILLAADPEPALKSALRQKLMSVFNSTKTPTSLDEATEAYVDPPIATASA